MNEQTSLQPQIITSVPDMKVFVVLVYVFVRKIVHSYEKPR